MLDRRRDRAGTNAARPRPPRRAPDGNAIASARAASRASAGASSLRCTKWISREPGEIGEAARVVQRRLVGDERDVEVAAQAAQQFGDAPRAAVPRRKHGERRDHQQTRPRGRFVVRAAQPVAVRRSTQRDGLAVRSGEPRRWQGLRRTRARQPLRETRPRAWPRRASSRWLAYGSSQARSIIHARPKPPMPLARIEEPAVALDDPVDFVAGIEAGGRHPMLVRGVRPRTEEDAQAVAPGAHAPLGILPIERIVAAARTHVAAERRGAEQRGAAARAKVRPAAPATRAPARDTDARPTRSAYQSVNPVSSRRPDCASCWKICDASANTSGARDGSSSAIARGSSVMSLFMRYVPS